MQNERHQLCGMIGGGLSVVPARPLCVGRTRRTGADISADWHKVAAPEYEDAMQAALRDCDDPRTERYSDLAGSVIASVVGDNDLAAEALARDV
jgi:hypothetical protein